MPELFQPYLRGEKPYRVMPLEEMLLMRDIGGVSKDSLIRNLDAETRGKFIRNAEPFLEQDVHILPAHEYMMYAKNGNRSVYEGHFFERRKRLLALLFGELAEGQGRFSPYLADVAWAICEESTWVLPAHNPSRRGERDALTYAWREADYIDLFAATTAACMALVCYFGREVLDAESPLICERILDELDRRILVPFADSRSMGWMGYHGHPVNNWNPWIVSNVLLVTALCEAEDSKRAALTAKCMEVIDFFTKFYAEDGGCDEGCGYWGVAGASYFDTAELLYDITGGTIDVTGDPFVCRVGAYIVDFYAGGGWCVNFADCSPKAAPPALITHRFGRRTGSVKLQSFGAILAKSAQNVPVNPNTSCPYRAIRDLYELPQIDFSVTKAAADTDVWYPGIQVMLLRENDDISRGLFLAVKGGHNAESHNHNDVGSFTVYDAQTPLIIDAGVETYTAQTFSAQRYELWTMQSAYHNVPDFNGVQQMPGGSFRAENVTYEQATRTLRMELTKTYPPEAGIRLYERAVSMVDGAVTVEDVYDLGDADGTVDFHLLLAEKPSVDGGVIHLSETRDALPLYANEAMEIRVEEIVLSDAKILRDWNRTSLWRLTIRMTVSGRAKFILEIK